MSNIVEGAIQRCPRFIFIPAGTIPATTSALANKEDAFEAVAHVHTNHVHTAQNI